MLRHYSQQWWLLNGFPIFLGLAPSNPEYFHAHPGILEGMSKKVRYHNQMLVLDGVGSLLILLWNGRYTTEKIHESQDVFISKKDWILASR